MVKLLVITFQYNLSHKNHFKSLLKQQLKTISIFLLIFTFCYFAINLEAFLYNFPYNTPLVLKTYVIFIVIIFMIMFLISIIFSLISTCICKKNNVYHIYNYKLDKNKLSELSSNFTIDLKEIKKIKTNNKYIKLISLKLKQVITFEKQNFNNLEDFNKVKKILDDFYK